MKAFRLFDCATFRFEMMNHVSQGAKYILINLLFLVLIISRKGKFIAVVMNEWSDVTYFIGL